MCLSEDSFVLLHAFRLLSAGGGPLGGTQKFLEISACLSLGSNLLPVEELTCACCVYGCLRVYSCVRISLEKCRGQWFLLLPYYLPV